MRARTDSVEDLRFGTVEIDPLDARPRRHDRSHRAVGEVENALDHVALDGMNYAQSGALRDEIVNIILGQGALEARAHVQQAQEEACRPAKQPDQRRGHFGD